MICAAAQKPLNVTLDTGDTFVTKYNFFLTFNGGRQSTFTKNIFSIEEIYIYFIPSSLFWVCYCFNIFFRLFFQFFFFFKYFPVFSTRRMWVQTCTEVSGSADLRLQCYVYISYYHWCDIYCGVPLCRMKNDSCHYTSYLSITRIHTHIR